MKFKKYILNEGRSKSIDKNQAIKLLSTKCSDSWDYALKNDSVIFRGVDNNNSFLSIDTSIGEDRRSANTHNYYNVLLSHLMPSWKKYPRRDRSAICSTYSDTARNYGKLYHVFPYNGTKIGVCPTDDIWSSFKTIGDLVSFNNWFRFLLRFLNQNLPDKISAGVINNPDKDDITEIFNKFTYHMKTYESFAEKYFSSVYPNGFNRLLDNYWNNIDKSPSLLTFLDKNIFDPNKNGFELINTKQMNKLSYGNREVWFSGKAVMLSDIMFSTIKSLLG